MARCTPAQVRAIKPSELSDEGVSAFIDAATLLVDRVEAKGSFSTDELTQIECWYSAHLMCAGFPDLTEEKVEGFSSKFGGLAGAKSGVLSTRYGQMANTLSKGCLAELDKPEAFYVTPA